VRLQAGIIVVVVAAIGFWMATRGGSSPPADLIGERDRLVADADVLVAEFTSGSETPARVLTQVGPDAYISAWQGQDFVQTEAGQFFELLPGCWVAHPNEEDLPMVPALTVARSLRSAPRLVNQGDARYSYFYQFAAPRFISVVEDLHALDGGLITATTQSGAPGGPNGIFTIREADPAWAAQARAIIAELQPSESTVLRVRYQPSRGLPGVSTAIVARDCPFLLPGVEETRIQFEADGAAMLLHVSEIPLSSEGDLPLPAGKVPLVTGLRFVVPTTPSVIYEIRSCRATEWLQC
jgi:hypothetical protein